MRTWHELESEFRSLGAPHHDARLDYQWGAAGEYWRIAGIRPGSFNQRFQALSAMAGTKLLQPGLIGEPEIVEETNDVVRWYRALVHFSGAFKHGHAGTQLDEDGMPAGNIYTGSIPAVTDAAANMCLIFESYSAGIDADSRVLSGPRYSGPREHWAEANRLLELELPDWPGVVHEAVSAVEGLARLILGDSTITLGKAVDVLRSKGLINSALAKCIDGVWAYSSSVPGIRHGASESIAVAPSEARFVFEVCRSSLQLLESVDAQRG